MQAAGLEVVVANELLPQRVALYRENFQHPVLEGDIRKKKKEIIELATKMAGRELFLLYATPPCQGMSSNGLGKLNAEVAAGRRGHEDDRNRLVIPAMDVAIALRPRWVLFENVPGMERTTIRTSGSRSENIISYMARRLGPEYVGRAETVACEDYGIPQRRKRLITIFTRDLVGGVFTRKMAVAFWHH